MDANNFEPLALIQLPTSSRLLANACCPDKDLVVLISRLGGKDRISLWKLEGPKKWEVDVGTDETNSEEIVDIAWSPNGQSIVVAHNPPRITIHSIQDGHEEHSLSVIPPASSQRKPSRLLGVWWFRTDSVVAGASKLDIFRRNGLITGSSLSFLKTLPLLDNLQDAQKTTATDLFAFQGSHTRPTPKNTPPDVVKSWPALLPDPLVSSINVPEPSSQISLDEVDTTNYDSILTLVDNLGNTYFFLDGSYPTGVISLGTGVITHSLVKHPTKAKFYAHMQHAIGETAQTDVQPTIIELSLLNSRLARDMARMSSTARDLIWYTMRVVKEMRTAWFGSETQSGARELGPRWIRALEMTQKDHFGQDDPNPIVDLTSLLLTGRASESLQDFLGSNDQMGERGISKWETNMADALIKMRDYSEKRVAFACQRLHLVLEEVQGWAQLPQYSSFNLSLVDINECLDLVKRAIVISSWLAAIARREYSRFKQFISWLRYETAIINPANEVHPFPRHDILEVNSYFVTGLVVSSIDKWFMGPIPRFTPQDLGVPADDSSISGALERAKNVVGDPNLLSWNLNNKTKDLTHLDRNLDGLIQEVAIKSQRVFSRAAGAAARTAIVSLNPSPVTEQAVGARPASKTGELLFIRERTIRVEEKPDLYFQYLAIGFSSDHQSSLCLCRMHYDGASSNFQIEATRLRCRMSGSDTECDCDLVSCDFFDKENVVIIYRPFNEIGNAYLATVKYSDLDYHQLKESNAPIPETREALAEFVLRFEAEKGLPSLPVPVKRCRRLLGCESGSVSLAVNGRVGRRVACILDEKGLTLETVDLGGEDGDNEEDQEGDGG